MPRDADDVRPLLAGPVRWDADGATIAVGRHEVRVDGAPDRLREILGDCDGRTQVRELARRHGGECRDLLSAVAAQGGVVDGEQAWRVLHRQGSVGTALGEAIGADELRALQDAAYAPAEPGDAVVALAPAASAVGDLAARRRSTRPADSRVPATFASLSTVLEAAYAVPAGPAPRSGTVPSAGALYPLVVHVLLRAPLGPAGTGLWWHDPAGLALHRVAGAGGPVGELFVPEPGCTDLLAREQPVVFLSADLRRPSRKYGPRGYRYALIEAGAALQSATLAATEIGLPLRAIGGIDDDAVQAFLALPDGAVPLLALLVGS